MVKLQLLAIILSLLADKREHLGCKSCMSEREKNFHVYILAKHSIESYYFQVCSHNLITP